MKEEAEEEAIREAEHLQEVTEEEVHN
jgi:hypothetical protein